MRKIFSSFITSLTFITVIPVPKRFIPSWDSENLRYFCLMLPVTGVILGMLWLMMSLILSLMPSVSPTLRGFMMMMFTLALTGGLHLDGLMDTCDALFSHRDRQTRLKILSDTHAGSFAVMGCVAVMMSKTLLFAELSASSHIALIPVFSRLGMALLLCNMIFAKNDGLAVTLGSSRNQHDNFAFVLMFLTLSFTGGLWVTCSFALSMIIHVIICVKIFGGITGDLLGAFVEVSEIIMLFGTVVENCI